MSGNSDPLGDFVRDLGDSARRNPLSAALIGAGAVWLFASHFPRGTDIIRRAGIDRLPEKAREVWEGTGSNLRAGAEMVRDTASGAADAVFNHGNEAADQVMEVGKRLTLTASDYAEDFPERASNLFDDVRGNMSDLFRSHPLAIGAVGLAIGAAIAASFPTTETEAEYLGETSDFVKDKATEIAGEQVERATEVGKKVAEAVADEARQQGLTVEGLKSAATVLTNKAGRVAGAVTGSAPASANPPLTTTARRIP
jgi:hypothetical protein